RQVYGRRLEPRTGCHLIAGRVAPRVRQLQEARAPVRATCRAADGFCPRLARELPWSHPFNVPGHVLAPGKPPPSLGPAPALRPASLALRTTTPESVIQLSACLARSERLVFRGGAGQATGRVIVSLRDFDAGQTEFPVLVSYSGAETWLRGAPELPLALPPEDRLAVARWLYPPGSWLDEELLGRLL